MELFSYMKGKCKNIQLILAGHSPFIVSDLPKEKYNFSRKRLNKFIQWNRMESKLLERIFILYLADGFFVEGWTYG
jgi:hypothetical protein